MLKNILAVLFALIIVAVVVFVTILVYNYVDYLVYGCYDDMIEVPFSTFKQVYLAIPEQFSLDDWYYKNHNKFYKFRYFGAIRYKLFCYFENKRKSKRNNVTRHINMSVNLVIIPSLGLWPARVR